jgi:hypothetical protein
MSQSQPCEKGIDTEAEYLDLKKLSKYSSLGVPTLRDRLREGIQNFRCSVVLVKHLRCYRRRGEVLY